MSDWNFDGVTFKHSVCLPQKTMERLNQLDSPLDAMRRLNREYDQLPFLLHNMKAFKEIGLLEQAVVELYIMLGPSYGAQGMDAWKELFALSERDCLRATPVQSFCPIDCEKFTIYRGCMPEKLQDISWTLSLEKAQQDVKQHFGGRAQEARVYQVAANMDDVAFFTNARGTLEVVLHPASPLFSRLHEEVVTISATD